MLTVSGEYNNECSLTLTLDAGFLIAPWLRHVGGRKIIRISGVVLCVGYLLSSQATSIFTLFFTYGIICGICDE